MANSEKLKRIISNIQILNNLTNSMVDSEIYPVSFFSQAFDLIQKIQSDMHNLEADQVEMFATQMKKHQALIMSIHQQMRNISTVDAVAPPVAPITSATAGQPVKTAANPARPSATGKETTPLNRPASTVRTPVTVREADKPGRISFFSRLNIGREGKKPETPPVVRREVRPVEPEKPPIKREATVLPPEPPEQQKVKARPAAEQEQPAIRREARPLESEKPMIKPEPLVMKPEPPIMKPEPHVIKPEPPVMRPEPPVMKPEPSVMKPEPPIIKSAPPIIKPPAPVFKSEPIIQHVAPTAKATATPKATAEGAAPPSVNDIIEKNKLSDLRRAFSLNDRFRYRRELFAGNEDAMNRVIMALNNRSSLKESLLFLEEKLHWDFGNPTVKDFIKILEMRFL
ncbi:MAG: hypothetical protein LBT42_08265 [Tannerella sp.]|nr:hypothetical protein [Tannerella sp.]